VAYNAHILLGVIVKAHGFDGTVSIRLAGQFRDKIHEMESVFVETDGKPVPFFIAESEYTGDNTLRVRFDGYESVDKVSEFLGCKVFLTSSSSEQPREFSWKDLIGFNLFSPGKTHIGVVKDIIENPGQVLLEILSDKSREILIPFHEDLIVSFDKVKGKIVMDLPEGLDELN
jgi:16S rRNA processing protein RimM